MLLTSPMSLEAAVQRLESKTPVAADLTSAQWAEVKDDVREMSFFSSRVTDIHLVESMQEKCDDALTLTRRDGGAFVDKSKFIADLRSEMGAAPGDSGKLTDITSYKRLGLIYEMNTQEAIEFGRWKARQDPDLLAAFPCWELVRVEHREIPRGYRKGPHGRLVEVPQESWPSRFAAAGGRFFDGRMIARKDDPVWVALSRFGRPWPPFDFNSGMGLMDVDRDEAERLGIVGPDTDIMPDTSRLRDGLAAPAPEAEDLRKLILESLGPKFAIEADDVIRPVERTRTWQELKLESATTWTDLDTGPDLLPADDALNILQKGLTVDDYTGQKVTFGQEALGHWSDENKRDILQRASHLSWATDTVSDPREVWEANSQLLYIQAYERDAGKYRGCIVSVLTDPAKLGEVHTYYVQQLKDLDRARKGLRRIYPKNGGAK
jgi:hypothetical protein